MEETLDPDAQSCGDTKEGFYLGREAEDDELHLPLHTKENLFPDESKHAALKGWKAAMEKYHADCTAVGHRVNRLIALSLGLPAGFFAPFFDRPMATLRLLHYDQTTSAPADGVFACGAHTDYGMTTLLATDAVAGLQIEVGEGEWLDVPPQPDAFIVNLGDSESHVSFGLMWSASLS